MEDELAALELKWEEEIPDPSTLITAHATASEKWKTIQVEQLNAQLHEELGYQQFLFASLQSRLLRAPLWNNGHELYESCHRRMQLGTSPAERTRDLEALFQTAIRNVPDVVARATRGITASASPHSQTHVTGGVDHTLVSSVFVAEIPHASLQDVFDATMAYFVTLPVEMERHLGTSMHVTVSTARASSLTW